MEKRPAELTDVELLPEESVFSKNRLKELLLHNINKFFSLFSGSWQIKRKK